MVTYMAQKVTKNNTDITSKLVDELLSQVDPSEILSKDGLLSKLKKQLVERVLQSELEHELGYDKHSKGLSKCKKLMREKCKFNAYYTQLYISCIKKLVLYPPLEQKFRFQARVITD